MQVRSADVPIEHACEDRLTRSDFASAIAEDIRRAPIESGFVIGVTGPWGDGKTSILRMVEESLTDSEVAAVVRFNPWLFSGTEQLAEHFFSELAGQLTSKSRRLKRIGKALRGYGESVTPLREVPFVGSVVQLTGVLASAAGRAFGVADDESAKEKDTKLRKRLARLDRPIVVMVDDIDRLRDEEVIDLVRLVRLVGDFPNLIYVLAYDRPIVELILGGGDDRDRGRAYLDKIVHVSHELPLLRPEHLTELLGEAITELIPDAVDYHVDQDRFTRVFWGETRELFHTVRDVRRFANSLPTTLSLVGSEIDLADLTTLEALRLFEPEFYEGIVKARHVLTRFPRAAFNQEAETRDAKEALERIKEKATAGHVATCERLLQILFPSIERHLGGSHYGDEFLQIWRAERRVAALDVLTIYLHRGIPEGALAASEVERVVELLDDELELERVFNELDSDELTSLFRRLADHSSTTSLEAPERAINAILRQLPRLPDDRESFLGLSPLLEATRLIYVLLRRLEPDEVAAVFEKLQFPDLSSEYELVRMVGYREGSQMMVGEAEVERLKNRLVEAVLDADAGRLNGERDLGPLVALVERERAAALELRLADWITDDTFFVRLLQAHKVVVQSSSETEVVPKRSVHLNWTQLTQLVEDSVLRRRIGEIDRDWVEAEFDADTRVIWDLAVAYLDDPEAGHRDSARFMSADD
ncbi:MAG: KAP family P-loop NTPase fold protein, partial [Acidimicrobiia bacterium]